MAVLVVNTIGRNALLNPVSGAAFAAAAVGGDKFPNTGTEFVIAHNGSGAPITVTLVIQSTVDGQPITSKTVVIPNAESRVFGPYPVANYNDGNSQMNLTYSGITSLTVGIFKVGS